MPPPDEGTHPTHPPRRWGGNIDCQELVAGSTLYLPIPVDGALFSAGDGHGRQGDGEVSQLAIECAIERAELTLTVRDDMELSTPIARTPRRPGSRSGSTRISTRQRPSRRMPCSS